MATIAAADHIAAWAAALTRDQIPQDVIDAAKRSLVDVIGCALAGSTHATTERVAAHARRHLAGGSCFAVGSTSLGPLGAALVNGTAAHAWDFDDTCYEGIFHPSAVVWPAAQAAAELAGADGETLLIVYVCGVEAECALGRAFGDRLFARGFWTTALFGTVAAAVAAGRAIGLDRARLAQAIRLASCQSSGLRAVLGSSAKPLGVGQAAQKGVEAALLAAGELDGPADILENKSGWAGVFGAGNFEARALEDLGTRWGQRIPGFAFKLFPACSGTQAAVEAAIAIMRENALSAGDVVRAHCRVTPLVAASLAYDDPQSPAEAQFSMTYGIACALTQRGFGIDDLAPARLADPRLRAIIRLVRMDADASLAVTPDQRRDHPEAAIVRIDCADGRSFHRANLAARGMPCNPMPDDDLDRKFDRNAGAMMPLSAAQALRRRLRRLDRSDTARDLLQPAFAARA